MKCYKSIDQLVITPSVTTWVVFRKAVFGPSQNVVRFEKNQRKNLFLFTYKDNNSSKYYHSYQVQQNDVVSDSEIVTANQSYPDNRYPSQSYDKLVKGQYEDEYRGLMLHDNAEVVSHLSYNIF